jgi:hypothetical protein
MELAIDIVKSILLTKLEKDANFDKWLTYIEQTLNISRNQITIDFIKDLIDKKQYDLLFKKDL